MVAAVAAVGLDRQGRHSWHVIAHAADRHLSLLRASAWHRRHGRRRLRSWGCCAAASARWHELPGRTDIALTAQDALDDVETAAPPILHARDDIRRPSSIRARDAFLHTQHLLVGPR